MRFYYSISSAIWNPLGSSWSPGLPLELNKRTTPPVVTSRTISPFTESRIALQIVYEMRNVNWSHQHSLSSNVASQTLLPFHLKRQEPTRKLPAEALGKSIVRFDVSTASPSSVDFPPCCLLLRFQFPSVDLLFSRLSGTLGGGLGC